MGFCERTERSERPAATRRGLALLVQRECRLQKLWHRPRSCELPRSGRKFSRDQPAGCSQTPMSSLAKFLTSGRTGALTNPGNIKRGCNVSAVQSRSPPDSLESVAAPESITPVFGRNRAQDIMCVALIRNDGWRGF